jgi:hypothetical protein
MGRKRATGLFATDFFLVWDCAAGINKPKQKRNTSRRTMTPENFCMIFSFLTISTLFVQRTIRREKLNKQIRRAKANDGRNND